MLLVISHRLEVLYEVQDGLNQTTNTSSNVTPAILFSTNPRLTRGNPLFSTKLPASTN